MCLSLRMLAPRLPPAPHPGPSTAATSAGPTRAAAPATRARHPAAGGATPADRARSTRPAVRRIAIAVPRRVRLPQRVIPRNRVPVQRLRIGRPPRAAELLLFVIRKLEPRRDLVLLRAFGHEPWLVEVNRERLECDTVHAAVRRSWHHTVGRNEAPQPRIVVPGMLLQQSRSVQPLAGVIQRGLADAAAAHPAPGGRTPAD
jgi:hypothetical protein